ncbi:MAG: non-hydrolyzing UDP-N-acetylglucosamine 2-epimerase [Oligoflexus sp.]
MKKVLIVIGTRPEAIKMVPLYQALKQRSDVDTKLCVTAQHRGMLDQVLLAFDVTPDFDLNLMSRKQDLFDITTATLTGMKEVLQSYPADWVLVQGDTSTTMAASLAAFYMKIPVGHVEAGLRTGRKYEPWPEEINRKLTSVLADLHFAPTSLSRENLFKEGLAAERIFVTGNTVIDALKLALERIQSKSDIQEQLQQQFHFVKPEQKIILVTAHRRENFGHAFEDICTALKQLVMDHSDVDLIFPVHPNPNVREPVYRILDDGSSPTKRIHLMEPLDYLPFVYLLEKSHFIISDSGGVQEEASWLGKPLLIMRDTTERPEVLQSGAAKLVGTNPKHIQESAAELIGCNRVYQAMATAKNVFGEGDAALKIVDHLLQFK